MSTMPFWLEVLGKSHEVVSRHKFFGRATVGRGYDNDLVLDDPYVAAAHLRVIEDDDGHLWAEDLGGVNGSIANIGTEQQEPISRLLIAEEANLTVGKTRLRIRTAAFVVPAEMPAHIAVAGTPPRHELSLAAFCLVALVVSGVFLTWLSETGERKFANYLLPVLILPVIDLVWAGVWALVTRIVTGHGRFLRHTVIVLTAEIAFYAVDKVARLLEYSIAWTGIGKYETPLLWIMFAGVCFLHLRLVVPRRPRLMGAIVALLAVLAIGTQGILKAETEKQVMLAKGPSSLWPPFLQLRAPRAPATFFEATTALQTGLEVERKKEPAAGSIFGPDSD